MPSCLTSHGLVEVEEKCAESKIKTCSQRRNYCPALHLHDGVSELATASWNLGQESVINSIYAEKEEVVLEPIRNLN